MRQSTILVVAIAFVLGGALGTVVLLAGHVLKPGSAAAAQSSLDRGALAVPDGSMGQRKNVPVQARALRRGGGALPHDRRATIELGVMEFLNSRTVLHWAEMALGI
jgi:hypothetical protein